MDNWTGGIYRVRVARWNKVLDAILRATSDASIEFTDFCALLAALGFQERIRGDHHIFHKPGVMEIIDIQPKGHHAKVYQVKQVRNLIAKYGIEGETE